MNELEKVARKAAEDVSKAYDLTAWGHTERAAEILKNTRTALRQALEPVQMRPATREEKIVRPGIYEVPVEQQPADQGQSCYCPNCEALAKQEPVAYLLDGVLFRCYEMQELPEGAVALYTRELTIVERAGEAFEAAKQRGWKGAQE